MLLRGVLQRYRCLLVRSLFQRRSTPPAQRRGLGFCLAFLIGYPLVEAFHGVCWLLDRVLMLGMRPPSLNEPVFLIGNPRSGTTIAHRVLACDEERFFCFKSWEIAFPSLIQKYVLAAFARIDRLVGRPWERLVRWHETRAHAEINRYHQLGWFLPEEDDKILLHILAAPDLAYFFPFADFQRWARMDLDISRDEQDDVVAFYRRCAVRQAIYQGGARTLLSKGPFSSGRVEALARHFPGCRFVYLVRNPLDVIPSTISMLRAIIRLSFHQEAERDLDETVYDLLKFYYQYPLDVLDRLPPHRFLTVNYDDLLRDPKSKFAGIYQHFGWTLSPAFERRLDDEVATMRQHRSRHQYSLDDTIITRERIVADLRPVFERFGFDTREAASGECPA
jgi:hypothetical protein